MAAMSSSAAARWLVLAFVSLAMFGNYYAFDALNPVGPLLESQLGFSQAQIGLLDSAYNVAALLVLIAGGVIIDRAGTERAFVLFGSIAFVGAVVIAVGGSHLTMAAGRFVMGVGAEPMIVAATAVIGRWFKGKELGFAMGVNLMIAGSARWRPTTPQPWRRASSTRGSRRSSWPQWSRARASRVVCSTRWSKAARSGPVRPTRR